MKRFFHEELEAVRAHVIAMGEKAVHNVNLAIQALIEGDLRLVEEVLASDDAIDDLENLIDQEVARYISLRAPVASDLRLLFVAIKAGHDLERVGDEATSIAKRTRKIYQKKNPDGELGKLSIMREIAVEMLNEAIFLFNEESTERAIEISSRDKIVDAYNRENFRSFVSAMKQDPSTVEENTEKIFISKSLERVADHAQNIAEEVYYLLTAKSLKLAIQEKS